MEDKDRAPFIIQAAVAISIALPVSALLYFLAEILSMMQP